MAIKPRTNDVRPNKRVRTIFFFPFSRYNAREQFTFLPFPRWFRSPTFVKSEKDFKIRPTVVEILTGRR